MFEILSTSCDGGDCPTFLIDRTTETIRVRGFDPTEGSWRWTSPLRPGRHSWHAFPGDRN